MTDWWGNQMSFGGSIALGCEREEILRQETTNKIGQSGLADGHQLIDHGLVLLATDHNIGLARIEAVDAACKRHNLDTV